MLDHIRLLRTNDDAALSQVDLEKVDAEGVFPVLPGQDDKDRASTPVSQVDELHGKVAGITF